ncbi:hypothetical protein DRN97_02985, partial [Methanosarcinales archaeon]
NKMSKHEEHVWLDTEIVFSCPLCSTAFRLLHCEPDGNHKFILDKEQRDAIVARRVTDNIDTTYEWLAMKFGITRSTLLHEVLRKIDQDNKVLQWASKKLNMSIDDILREVNKYD